LSYAPRPSTGLAWNRRRQELVGHAGNRSINPEGVDAMTTPIRVSGTDLHTMMRIITAPDAGEDGIALPRSVLAELASLIRCEVVHFTGLDSDHRRWYFGQQSTGTENGYDDGPPLFWTHYWDSPCSYPDRTPDSHGVYKVTDLCSQREWRRSAMYVDLIGRGGIEHELMLFIADGPGRTRRLIFERQRGDRDFTERDRSLLLLLRPHLHAAHHAVLRRRRGIPTLTPRQWQLLRLIDAGYSNTQIARRLNITQNTVRTHLEHVFQRLEVTSRTAAVARAFPDRRMTIG
jgi:DNA-binding CsgD family transcriptional regulator